MQRNYRIGNDDYPAVVAVNPDGTPIGSGAAAATGSTAVTVADAADVTQGAKADSLATSSTGSWSVVALLKGIYAQLVLTVAGLAAATPAGSNVIGGVTVADGSDGAQGAKADALATNSTGSWTIVALLKGIYAQLVLTVAGLNAATPAGTNIIGKVLVTDGSNSTEGFTTDTPLTGTATTASASLVTILKGVYNLLTGTAKLGNTSLVTEASGTAVAASSYFIGTFRDFGAPGTTVWPNYFKAVIVATQAGNAQVQYSADGNTYYGTAATATTASIANVISVPVLARYMRVIWLCGGTAGNLLLCSSSTATA